MTVIARSEATKQSRKATTKNQPLPTIIPEAPKIFIMFAVLSCVFAVSADMWVDGYCRSDGYIVKGHYVPDANSPQGKDYSDSLSWHRTSYGSYEYDRCDPNVSIGGSTQAQSQKAYNGGHSGSVDTTRGYYGQSSYGGSHTIHTGPRGGQYYYNSKGKKTYVKKKK